MPVKSKSDVEQELTFHVVETNQPGLLGLRSSQNLGLIKVITTAKTEREETTTDNQQPNNKDISRTERRGPSEICTSLYWSGAFREKLPHFN